MAEEQRGAASASVPDQDVPELRPSAGLIDALATRIVGGQLPPLLSDEERKVAEAARAAADELAVGRDRYRRFFGSDPATDVIARAFARFDRGESAPQASEFYRFRDSQVETSGYI